MNEYKASEITITLIRDGYPRKLMEDLRRQGFQVECRYPGIYYVTGRLLFDTQIVVASQLEEAERIWLQTLKRHITQEKFGELMKRVKSLQEEDEKQLAGAVGEVGARANEECVEQWKEDDVHMYETLRRIFATEISEEKEQVKKEGLAEYSAKPSVV